MAKHAQHTTGTKGTYAGQLQQTPYVYPDGTVYGAPKETPEQRQERLQAEVQAQYYSRANFSRAAQAAQYQRAKQRKKRRKGAIIAAVLGVLLVLAGVGLFVFKQSLDSKLALPDVVPHVSDILTDSKDDHAFYALIIGSDSRSLDEEDYSNGQLSDVMILARVDKEHDTVTLVSIPRDTPWRTESGELAKLNEAYSKGGAYASVDAVSKLCGVPISHYAETHYREFGNLVDAIGGIDYDVPIALGYTDPLDNYNWVQLEAGQQHLNGQQTTILVRARHEYGANQEAARQGTIRGVMKAIFDKIKSLPVTSLPAAASAVANCVDTDLDSVAVLSLMFDLGSDITFYNVSGPYEGGIDPQTDSWFCYENPEGWKRLIDIVDSGEDPSGISYAEDTVYYPSSGEVVPREEG